MSVMMRAAVFYGPQNVKFENREIPDIDQGDILIRIKYCAICGTDVRIYNYGQANVTPPMITGHELTGIIEKIGSEVTHYEVGNKVLVVPQMTCGKCQYCLIGKSNLCEEVLLFGYSLDGGFAEYIQIPAQAVNRGNVIKLDDNADLLDATLTEPLSCVINGQEHLHIGIGDEVMVIGAGAIGAMHVALAKAKGAGKIILADVEQDRLELAGKCGADHLVNAKTMDLVQEVMHLTKGKGVDVAIAACSVPVTQSQGLQVLKKGGRLSLFAGLPKDHSVNPLDMNLVHYKEISVYGAYASTISQHVTAYNLLAKKIVDGHKIITNVLPMEQLIEGFGMVKKGKGLKIVVKL
jgi:L-iditol 2-dehydrogenase